MVKANPESISNTKIRGNIEFTRLSEDKNPLQGAAFKIYKETDTNFEAPIVSAISDENGEVKFEDIDYGNYTSKETKAPKGYILSKEELEVKVNSSEIQKFTIKNEAEKLIDKISKVLPKTGSLFNFNVIMIIGWGTIIMGLGLFLKKNKAR